MLTSSLHLFSKKPIDVTGEIPVALALISFLTWPLQTWNDSVAWVAAGYVNSNTRQIMPLLSFTKMPRSMVTLFIKQPPHASHLPGPGMGLALYLFKGRKKKEEKKLLRGRLHNNADLFSNASLPKRYLSNPSSPPRIKHLLNCAEFQETFSSWHVTDIIQLSAMVSFYIYPRISGLAAAALTWRVICAKWDDKTAKEACLSGQRCL